MPEYKSLGTSISDNLIAGDYPIVTEGIIIATGQNLTRGAVLGREEVSGKYLLSESSATDGSENPVAILAASIDSTNGETESVCYLSGQFNYQALVFGAGLTSESEKHNLRLLNIYITEPQ